MTWLTIWGVVSVFLSCQCSSLSTNNGKSGEHRIWHSQYGQDRFIYDRFFATYSADAATAATAGADFRKGVFVELGAADGLDKSNTLAFERLLGWSGVLIEPSEPLFERLRQSRSNCTCVNSCVTRVAGEYSFSEDGLNSGLSMHVGSQTGTRRYCRTLGDILNEHLGPSAHIDYLSLDVEGAELDVLQSLDLRRYVVDVLTIEVHEWRDQARSKRLTDFLLSHGYHYVDRLVMDEVWVRRRGWQPDPSCMLAGIGLQETHTGPKTGWAGVRDGLRKMHMMLATRDFAQNDARQLYFDPDLVEVLREVAHAWDAEESILWEDQCPVGVLSIALATVLLYSRKTSAVLDPAGVSTEFRQHSIFQMSSRVVALVEGYGFEESVQAAELAGEHFQVRVPLGRPWHESSFLDILHSGWPFFGLLDACTRVSTSGGHFYDKVGFSGNVYHFPVRVPRLPCVLEVPPDGRPRLEVPPRMRRGRPWRTSSSDAVLDADTCGQLGVAAARFHTARAELRAVLETQGSGPWLYLPLANWTATCIGAAGMKSMPLGQAAVSRCSKQPLQVCSALDGNSRAVPRRCLRNLRPSPGESLRVRRSAAAQLGTSVGLLIAEGERLFRAFVDKHGFFAAVFAASMRELAPPTAPTRGTGADGVETGETLFAVLQTIQDMLVVQEVKS